MPNGGGALGERNPLTCTPPGWGTYRGLGGLIYEMILYMMWGKNEKFDIKRQVNSSFLNIFKTINSSNKTLRIFVRRSAHIKLL